MNQSTSIAKIAPALLAAQKKMGAAEKGSTNPYFHSKYADLGAVMEACKDELNANGISVLQPVGSDELGVYVETVLLHESGEYISDRMRLAVKQANDPQAQGSAITYARRYSLQSMVFVPAEDDDAEKATNHMDKKVETKVEAPMETRAQQITGSIDEQIAAHKKSCPDGTPFKILESHSTANYGRKYKKCTQCGAFLGWNANPVEEEPPIEEPKESFE